MFDFSELISNSPAPHTHTNTTHSFSPPSTSTTITTFLSESSPTVSGAGDDQPDVLRPQTLSFARPFSVGVGARQSTLGPVVKWQADEATDACMRCASEFGLLLRKCVLEKGS